MLDFETYKKETIEQIALQRSFFAQRASSDLDYRLNSLTKLKDTIARSEKEIGEALNKDLGKSYKEAYLTETGIVLGELKLHIRNLKKWAKPHKVPTPLFLFPSRSYTLCEPFGVTLILSPWNYPFQLLFNPLIASVSAGNCVIAKPSPYTPHTNQVIGHIINDVFDPRHVRMIEGDSQQTLFILEQPFDFIFYTGSSSFGKNVMQAAAKHLTPIVLELGGKSPCIVDQGCNIDLAAKRIIWGKLLNAGQTCVAPDYIWVHHSLQKPLVEAMIKQIIKYYTDTPLKSPFYPRIIHKEAFSRLKSYLDEGTIVYGGELNEEFLKISPTLLCDIKPESRIMREEIFGPIMPILPFHELGKVIHEINNRPKPLALYYFGKEKIGKQVIRETSSGGACLNDVILHLSNHHLPFGGVGASGMGTYHGKFGFEAFSNTRSLLYSSTKIDFSVKYVPFPLFSWVKRLL